VARWGDLTEHLVSAKVTGRDHSEFEGRSRECEAIEAVYQTKLLLPALPAVGLLTRSFCVDPVRLLILRERLEAAPRPGEVTHYSRTVTYSRVAYDSPQPADIFQFRPPAGSSDGRVSLPLAGEGGSDAGWLGSGGTPAPVLIFKHEPQYTPEALKAKLQGTVLVSLVIDEEGRPQNIRVVRGLGMGLDEKAIEAVSTWWFEPGYGAGLPIAVPARVEVNFRIP
jgi:TonB family protein